MSARNFRDNYYNRNTFYNGSGGGGGSGSGGGRMFSSGHMPVHSYRIDNKPRVEKRERSPYNNTSSSSNRHRESDRYASKYEIKGNINVFEGTTVNVSTLRRRFYNHLYIPSDFVNANLSYNECFPLFDPFVYGNKTEFKICHKEVDRLDGPSLSLDFLEPKDANYKYSAKVMLLDCLEMLEIYAKTTRMADETMSEYLKKESLFRQLGFVVGSKGKRNDIMAIGGPWSPSLDGPNPEEDPQVLINTAIRTCRALTGIDLTKCVNWFKFLEIEYLRSSERISVVSKTNNTTAGTNNNEVEAAQSAPSEELIEPFKETVVIFLPDVHNCMPSASDWEEVHSKYQEILQQKLNPTVTNTTTITINDSVVEESQNGDDSAAMETSTIDVNTTTDSPTKALASKDDRTHFSKLTLGTMKVTDIRAELSARGIDTKGIKSAISVRLEEALQKEREEEEASVVMTTESVADESASADVALAGEEKEEVENVEEKIEIVELSERDKRRIERMYNFDIRNASILVTPHPKAKEGTFDCQRLTLQAMLNYSGEHQKEHTFEVSLFAEVFRDMLLRDGAFTIYKTLCVAKEKSLSSGTVNDEPLAKRPYVENGSATEKTRPAGHSKKTVDIPTLFAFSLYDTGHCEYIKECDLEDIIMSLGLNLSRSQIKKLVHKCEVKRDGFFYRCLTDKESFDEVVDKSELEDPEYILELANGNKVYMEDEMNDLPLKVMTTDASNVDINERINKLTQQRKTFDAESVTLKGSLCDVRDELITVRQGETALRLETKELRDKLNAEKEGNRNAKFTNKAYTRLMTQIRDSCVRNIEEVNKQFKKEAPPEPEVAEDGAVVTATH